MFAKERKYLQFPYCVALQNNVKFRQIKMGWEEFFNGEQFHESFALASKIRHIILV